MARGDPTDPKEMARLLLPQFLPPHADPTAADEDGATPFHKLAHANNSRVLRCELELAEMLLASGVEVDPVEVKHFTPLQTALWQGRNRLARFMLEHGADPNRPDPHDGRTALLNMHDWPNLDGIRLLVEFGADLDHQDKYGNTTLTSSIQRGKVEIAHLLLDLGASVNTENSSGWTPLTRALHNENRDMAARLISLGADLDVQEPWMVKAGTTVLMRIIQLGWPDLALACLERGADPHPLDARRYSALHWAVIKDQPEVVSTLLDLGVDAQVETVNHLTPLAFAHRTENARLIKLLTP